MQPKNNADNLGNVADIRGNNAVWAGQHGASEVIAGSIGTMDESSRLGNGGAVFGDEHGFVLLFVGYNYPMQVGPG